MCSGLKLKSSHLVRRDFAQEAMSHCLSAVISEPSNDSEENVVVFETGFLCVALAVLELDL